MLLASAPGDRHQFGTAMIEQFLIAAGWHVQTDMSGTLDNIVSAARENWFAVVGLTAGSDEQLVALTSTIAAIRDQSNNREVSIMVGGPIFTANPGLAHEVGADATAPNAPAAVLVAQKLFDQVAIMRVIGAGA